MAESNSIPAVKLASGYEMPMVSLGCWKSTPEQTNAAVKAAIRAGYRAIDCANDYGNEHEVGNAVKELIDAGEVTREELFIQAKLWNGNMRKENVPLDLDATLRDLQMEYIDSWLIHWPMACPALPGGDAGVVATRDTLGAGHHSERPFRFDGTPGAWMFPQDDTGMFTVDLGAHYTEAYAAMETEVDNGRVRSLGVCNFNKTQMEEVLDMARHPLSIIQVERHPYLQQKDLKDFCWHNGIVLQAFSPLGSNDRPDFCRTDKDPVPVLENPTLQQVAAKYGVTVAQVVLRWHIQSGVPCIPKSATPSRIEANVQLFGFELDRADMDTIADLNVGWRHLLAGITAHHPNFPFKDELRSSHVVGGAVDPNVRGDE